jgi:hypothetical protein
MNPQVEEARYQLTLVNYADAKAVPQICELIYQTLDKNLIASLSTLPYVVGRSFSHAEADRIHTQLKQLKVSHRFVSDLNGTTVFSFETTEKVFNAEQLTRTRRVTMKVRIRRKFFLGTSAVVVAAVCAVCFFALSKVQNVPLHPSTDQFEITIEKMERDVEYRLADDLIWKKASVSQGLQTHDAVRTFQNSNATLVYHEGPRLFVQPNTLLVIGKNPAADRNSVHLQDGSLKTRLKANRQPHYLSIETASGTLEMTSPKEGESKETKIETSVANGTLRVSVTQGQVTLKPTAKNAAPILLNSREQLTATAQSVSKPAPFEPALTLLKPPMNQILKVDAQQSTPTTFQWKDLGEDAEYELMLGSDEKMKEVFLRQKTKMNELVLNYLDIGTVYWQVVAVADGITYRSPVWQIHVQKPSE